jgi:hypothetical protein
MQSVPADVLELILDEMDTRALKRLKTVSRSMNSAVDRYTANRMAVVSAKKATQFPSAVNIVQIWSKCVEDGLGLAPAHKYVSLFTEPGRKRSFDHPETYISRVFAAYPSIEMLDVSKFHSSRFCEVDVPKKIKVFISDGSVFLSPMPDVTFVKKGVASTLKFFSFSDYAKMIAKINAHSMFSSGSHAIRLPKADMPVVVVIDDMDRIAQSGDTKDTWTFFKLMDKANLIKAALFKKSKTYVHSFNGPGLSMLIRSVASKSMVDMLEGIVDCACINDQDNCKNIPGALVQNVIKKMAMRAPSPSSLRTMVQKFPVEAATLLSSNPNIAHMVAYNCALLSFVISNAASVPDHIANDIRKVLASAEVANRAIFTGTTIAMAAASRKMHPQTFDDAVKRMWPSSWDVNAIKSANVRPFTPKRPCTLVHNN